MDLGIRGKKAIVNAASKGLGKACATSLAREGCDLVISARHVDVLEAAAEEIRGATGANVTAVVADVATDEGQRAVLAACPEPDILVNNCGGPPPGDFRDWSRDDWLKALDANMLSPIFLIKATVDGMIERKFGRVVNITSAAVKAPIAPLGLSNGARAGLTGFIGGLARQIAEHNVTINGLLPGLFATERLLGPGFAAAKDNAGGVSDALGAMAQNVPAKRLGDPAEFGEACAFLCSAHAGYITGQNLLLDGGFVNSSI